MSTAAGTAREPKWMLWTGRVISILAAAMLLFGAAMLLSNSAQAVEGMTKYGYPASAARWIGVAALASALLYLIPQTAVLGAVLMTGYLGGAVATHVRAGEQFILPVIFGMVVWAGLVLRDRRLRALLPLRSLR